MSITTTDQIPTPALLLDLNIFEASLNRMQSTVKQAGKQLRPHVKAHKCVAIAQRQIAAGANGLCLAVLAEAELMAAAGIEGLLLTSPVADPLKIARIVKTGAMIVVDHPQQAAWFQEAAKDAGRTVEVLIDLDPGDHRTGIAPGEKALALAQAIDKSSNLRLRGLQIYSVKGSGANNDDDRRRLAKEVYGLAAETRDAITRAGMRSDILSGGSTGTVEADCQIPAVTELQAGSYVVMDINYKRLGVTQYGGALNVLTTVISANHDAFVTVDGGFKAFATDRAFGPEAANLPGSAYRWGGDEFGYLDIAAVDRKPKLGDKIPFVPPHCDPTVNLYDRIYAHRGDRVEDIWPVKTRALAS